jgi:hypothetical protein
MNTRQPSDWLPLSEFCRNHPDVLPDRYAPLHMGQPFGPHRLRFMFGENRRNRVIEVRARPGYPNARHEQIPLCEWMGFVVDDSQSRLQHEHSGQWYYDVQVRLVQQDVTIAQSNKRSDQATVTACMLALYEEAHAKNRPVPKRELEAFPACRAATGATFEQMKLAMKTIPAELKRGRGDRDRSNRTD